MVAAVASALLRRLHIPCPAVTCFGTSSSPRRAIAAPALELLVGAMPESARCPVREQCDRFIRGDSLAPLGTNGYGDSFSPADGALMQESLEAGLDTEADGCIATLPCISRLAYHADHWPGASESFASSIRGGLLAKCVELLWHPSVEVRRLVVIVCVNLLSYHSCAAETRAALASERVQRALEALQQDLSLPKAQQLVTRLLQLLNADPACRQGPDLGRGSGGTLRNSSQAGLV